MEIDTSLPHAESHADPEVYPRPDWTVYICGEAETVDVPEDPADIEPCKTAVKALQVTIQSDLHTDIELFSMCPSLSEFAVADKA